MWRITALALGLWLCMMCGITWSCAWDVYHQYHHSFYEYSTDLPYLIDNWRHHEKEQIQADIIQQKISLHALDGFPFIETYACDNPYEYAIICYDNVDDFTNGIAPCLVEDGNYMYFYYNTTGAGNSYPEFAYIDLDETQFGRDIISEWKWQESIVHYLDDYKFERLTGWFEGAQFHLVEAAQYHGKPLTEEPETDWITVVDTAEPGQELVHIYPSEITIQRAATKMVVVKNEVYDNLEEMLLDNTVHNGRESIIHAVFESAIYFQDNFGGEYLIRYAAQASPLKVAFIGLLKFYAVTLLILVLILFLIYRGIRKKLVEPMNKLLKLVAEDSLYMPEPEDYWWKEPYEVYVQPRNAIHELKKEINQLNAALEYAKDAEDNRKRMISNITHELKTPLAVIHSYAEGLQEGIAGEHQDRYLDVILEETDQMDGMVLEMLDLSRLEAGKVRLASDRFSLPELTERVFEKLKPLMQEKELEVEFLWSQDYQITADEGRIGQAVTNLATNAIKYSPEGGKIVVQIYWYNGYFHFTIENQSDPIPEEDLNKLWNSFYRTDASRTEKGTGLGLTITKTIVELHGGSCAARNTPNGVQFEFELP
jgi:signal transduction histidine kinase